jgi:prepilin-type N-terminal cleavage/methylation domain-containing protein
MSKQRGFSLIEQLTVVAIIVVVALWLWLILH